MYFLAVFKGLQDSELEALISKKAVIFGACVMLEDSTAA